MGNRIERKHGGFKKTQVFYLKYTEMLLLSRAQWQFFKKSKFTVSRANSK